MTITRTTVATGIYRDQFGYEVRWRDRGRGQQKRFAIDTPLDTLKTWRKRQIAKARPLPSEKDGSFVRDVVRFLAARKGRPSFKSDRAHLRPWVQRFKRLSRFAVTRDHVISAVAEWQQDGYSARELRHRVRLLRQMYLQFDPDQSTPADRIPLPSIPKPRPVSVSDATVREVALNLRKQEHEGIGRLRNAKTRARFLVLATTGQRPSQMKRAQPMDVDLERRIWFVRPAKGGNGSTVYLNEDMLRAWQLFIQAKAWGAYDTRSFAKTLRRNGWPAGIRPYALRHSVGLSLSERGVDLGDIQSHMGHTSPATTRQFYVPGVPQRMKDASAKLEGRIGTSWAAGLPQPPATKASGRMRKQVEFPNDSKHGATRANAPIPHRKPRKLA